MKYTIYTLGCKVNQFETQAMEKMLWDKGFYPDAEDADVVIINTCAVTAESSRKSRQAIRRLKKYHPNAMIAVCGCLSQLEPDEISSLGADIVFGSGGKERFVDAIMARTAVKELDDPFKRRYFEELPAGAVYGRTRALLKIQDGCDNFCTYCIIPYTRGRVRSLPLDSCMKQASGLAEEGYRELVITGIEIASYGKDLPGRPGLADALRVIDKTRAAYVERIDALIDGLNAVGWQIDKPKATMFVWAPVPEGFGSSEEFVKTLLERSNVLVTPGSAFGKSGEGFVRMALVQTAEVMRKVAAQVKFTLGD